MGELTNKQQAFINEYCIDLNATQAAVRAGYSVKTANEIGNQNLAKISIRSEIDKRLKERAIENGVSADMVLMDLLELKDKCLGKKAVKVSQADENGKLVEIEKFVFDSSGAKSSLELLGKHLKLFTEKIESENVNLNHDMSNLSDEDIEKEIEKLKK